MRFLALCAAFSLLLIAATSSTASAAPELVQYRSAHHRGTIEIHHKERALYLILRGDQAIRYRVAVPKNGMEWSGPARIQSKHKRPAWSPPAIVKRDNPHLPDVIPGGDPKNPMGEAALMLDRDQIAIHGTAAAMRGSIGSAASYGCVRMLNEDILDLYKRVRRGTLVVMLP